MAWRAGLHELASTGIGSLPHVDLEAALRLAFSVDIPHLPQLPNLSAQELLLPPVARQPSDLGLAFEAFIERLHRQRTRCAKVQVAGPVTSPQPKVELLRAVSMIEAMTNAGVQPIVFLDEPVLVPGLGDSSWTALARAIERLQRSGAIVGVHCCNQAPWGRVLSLPVEIVSFDARLSLEAIRGERKPLGLFLARDGVLCVGVIATSPGPEVAIALGELAPHTVLSPACGLALQTEAEAERVFAELTRFQTVNRFTTPFVR